MEMASKIFLSFLRWYVVRTSTLVGGRDNPLGEIANTFWGGKSTGNRLILGIPSTATLTRSSGVSVYFWVFSVGNFVD